MNHYVRHIALVVHDLQEAEAYYQNLFQMELIGRETELADGKWYTLPYDKGWEDAKAAGIELKMLALKKGDIVLALFSGPQPPGQVFAIGLAMPKLEWAEVEKRLTPGVEETFDYSGQFNFKDRYGITWQLVSPGDQFMMNGDSYGWWLEV
jgi:catechol 2,3-dioxygenase-like lactoylglutathione lyase family enzyme